jgi:hypothetical protein
VSVGCVLATINTSAICGLVRRCAISQILDADWLVEVVLDVPVLGFLGQNATASCNTWQRSRQAANE